MKIKISYYFASILLITSLCSKSYAAWETLTCENVGKQEFLAGELYQHTKFETEIKTLLDCNEVSSMRCYVENKKIRQQNAEASFMKERGASELLLNKSKKLVIHKKAFSPVRWPKAPQSYSLVNSGKSIYSYFPLEYPYDLDKEKAYIDYDFTTKILRTGFIPVNGQNYILEMHECH